MKVIELVVGPDLTKRIKELHEQGAFVFAMNVKDAALWEIEWYPADTKEVQGELV
jgi:hypothetical protein